MALYDIHHSCGHTTEQQIYGPNVNGEREAEAKRRGEHPCPTCRREQHNEQNQAAAERADREGWPELTGTRKQIAWAETLRAAAIDRVTTEVSGVHPSVPALLDLATAILLRHTEAPWWIDQRFQRSWLGFLNRPHAFPEWVEAASPNGPDASVWEAIQRDLENVEEETDLVHAVLDTERALIAGRITADQWREVLDDAQRIRLRLDAEWGA